MASIWKQQKDVNEHPNRNNFDLSKKSNISMKFGTLYPVYCQPVVPGDSFSIDTAFNLKLMPVVFPVQTKMRAHMHYFYVRNKNIWSNWENWISNLVGQSEYPHPYISLPDNKFKTGSIHDFLGVPTSLVNHSDLSFNAAPVTFGDTSIKIESFNTLTEIQNYVTSNVIEYHAAYSATNNFVRFDSSSQLDYSGFSNIDKFDVHLTNFGQFSSEGREEIYCLVYAYDKTIPASPVSRPISFTKLVKKDDVYVCNLDSNYKTIADTFFESRSATVKKLRFTIVLKCYDTPSYNDDYDGILTPDGKPDVLINYVGLGFNEYSNLGLNLYSNHLHINALPYRAYESIYYTYYNNNVLNPLKIGGVPQYNRYNTNLGDGADTTDYHLFNRNYELDFLTSSLPSPQQGVAPVVGMTALGDVTIEDENGITTAHAEIDNDGTITKVILTSPAASVEHARTAMNLAACGMSISDFRQTNALQRFLETNIRKGYRYMDFIAGHFGKEPEYRELDLPEFIGGFSRDVSVSTVVSNSDTLGDNSGKALGAYGGYAQVVGGGKSSIRHYCDDYGFIIGIMSVVPTPCYSQLLPKHMVAPDNFLDYYFPEFSSSGLQPITYKEVAPIQSYLDSILDASKSLEDTFGYQRPNYDLVSAVDEVHGEFRSTLRNYVINRIFDTRPELGQSFISINPSEINDIFVNTNPDDDCIIGEIGFAVHAKRPIPRVVIPNLGK